MRVEKQDLDLAPLAKASSITMERDVHCFTYWVECVCESVSLDKAWWSSSQVGGGRERGEEA